MKLKLLNRLGIKSVQPYRAHENIRGLKYLQLQCETDLMFAGPDCPFLSSSSLSLTELPVQLDGHELNFRISRFDVDGSEEEAQGIIQLCFAVALPPS